ncbi:sperm-associated antigen 1-like [Hibiscus syriacus]|uniref:sperm-associated antigen 1-like n=1 Tax=Hibiscus syriacus TaxID=106335 RepID=UPI001924FFD7|nr:sperm-associated antigen 1-like [Hibiscus syriacus]
MATASFNKVERAHQMYREGRYDEALGYYTEALAVAKTKPQKIGLHSNRAACYLKLHHFKEAAEECTSVLELDHKHTGALMLRAQTLVTLKEYNSALFDVNQLIELDPSSEVYHNLQARLKTQVALAPIPESEAELEEEEEEHEQPSTREKEASQDDKKEDMVVSAVGKVVNAAELEHLVKAKLIASEKLEIRAYAKQETYCKNVAERTPGVTALQEPNDKDSKGCQLIPKSQGYSGQIKVPQRVAVTAPREQGIKDSKGWQAIPKPKGHSTLDYARWDRVENDSSEEDDDDEDSQPQYRFRVRTVGIRPVK